MAKILAMSNIHGRFYELLEVLNKVNKEYRLEDFDQIIFLGDYIAFGYQNKEVIDFLMKFKKAKKNVTLLKGNWEDALHAIQRSRSKELENHFYQSHFSKYGQSHVLKELRGDKKMLNAWLDEIENMSVATLAEDYFFSHAGLNMNDWGTVSEDTFFSQLHESFYTQSVGNEFTYRDYCQDASYPSFPYKIIMGQTAINKMHQTDNSMKYDSPYHFENLFGIDFGAIYTKGRLGAVVIDGNKIKSYVYDVLPKSKVIKNASNSSTPVQKPVTNPSSSEWKKKQEEKQKALKNTLEETWDLYNRGLSIQEIAIERDLKEATVEGHLLELYKQGKKIHIHEFYDEQHVPIVMKAIETYGANDVKMIKSHVPRNITYTEIKAIGVLHKVM